MTFYVISTSFSPLPPSLVGKYIAFVDSLTCSPPYSCIIFLHSRSSCFSVFIDQSDDQIWCCITGRAKVFGALTFRGIDMLLDHITVTRFKNSSLTSSRNISASCVLFPYFPRNLYLSFLSSVFSCSSLLKFTFVDCTFFPLTTFTVAHLSRPQ